jgi:hypothetical protein
MAFKNWRRAGDLDKVRTGTAGLNALAMSMVLPHENKPVRFPVVPAALTATIDLMSDRTYPVADAATRRAFLCRDAAYPLWVERTVSNAAVAMIDTSIIIPVPSNKSIGLGEFTMSPYLGASPMVDSVVLTSAVACDMTPMARVNGKLGIYVPYGSTFVFQANNYGALVAGGTLELTFECLHGPGEVSTTVVTAVVAGTGLILSSPTGGTPTTGTIVEGEVPYGFVRLVSAFTGLTSPLTVATNGTFRYGWSTGGTIVSPGSNAVVLLPFSNPPEANNSLLPYTKTRLNAAAALFTNVTAALNKEGTILGARLKSSTVSPWTFSESDLNSVHPKLRYFGPLEKGLYTFTTPSTDQEPFLDKWGEVAVANSSLSTSYKLLFDPELLGTYNAFVFADLGSGASGTQLAASCYVHLEFETVSSLFSPGVSTMTLETLHAAQIALLQFGHFHENPLHFSSIVKAAGTALRAVAPMIAPVVQAVGTRAVNAGVAYLKGKAGGDRSMQQARMVTPKASAGTRKAKRAQPARKRK